MQQGGKRKGAGRRPVQIDLVDLEKLCSIGCTHEDLAAFFGTCVRTIEKLRKKPEYAEIMKRGEGKGRISLRREQMKLVEKGSAPMAIWLGKQWLHQRDVTPIELTGAKGKPVALTLEVLDAIVALKQKA
jgi:hypothetical protein